MIEFLRIRDLGVISDAEVELGRGLVALTGETGAGKTMLVGALGLLLGGRADPGLIRHGSAGASVEALLRCELPEGVAADLAEAGADTADGLVIGRTVAEGRSRAFAGGRTVPAGLLRSVGEALVARHGQSDQQGLARPAVRRDLLDAYGGDPVAEAVQTYRAAYSGLAAIRGELQQLRTGPSAAGWQADALRAGLAEVRSVDPQPGEDEELAAQEGRLANAVDLRLLVERAVGLIDGAAEAGPESASVRGLLAAAGQEIAAAARFDPGLAAAQGQLAEALAVIADCAADLYRYADRLEADPQRLAAVQSRRSALTGLRRKYGPELSAVLAWAEQAQAQLQRYDGAEQRIEELLVQEAQALVGCGAAAARLTSARESAAERLVEQVGGELAALLMPHTVFEIALRHRPDPAGVPVPGADGPVSFGPSGTDLVDFTIRSGRGAPARSITESASGGELSRIMLALEVALAEVNPVPVYVFDEVDAGVGGRAAVEIGRRLARLAARAQVVVVTHLPQVAAFADQHVVVRKDSDGIVTTSSVSVLSGPGRVRELSRMLAGLEESATAAEHARELLDLADAERRGVPAR